MGALSADHCRSFAGFDAKLAVRPILLNCDVGLMRDCSNWTRHKASHCWKLHPTPLHGTDWTAMRENSWHRRQQVHSIKGHAQHRHQQTHDCRHATASHHIHETKVALHLIPVRVHSPGTDKTALRYSLSWKAVWTFYYARRHSCRP